MRKTVALVVQGVVAVTSVIALVLVVTLLTGKTDTLQTAVRKSSYQSCQLFDKVLHSFRTPGGKASARVILLDNPTLNDCATYARKAANAR